MCRILLILMLVLIPLNVWAESELGFQFVDEYTVSDGFSEIDLISWYRYKDKKLIDSGLKSFYSVGDYYPYYNCFFTLKSLDENFKVTIGDYFLNWGSRTLLSGSGFSTYEGFNSAVFYRDVLKTKEDFVTSNRNFRGTSASLKLEGSVLDFSLNTAVSFKKNYVDNDTLNTMYTDDYFHTVFFRNKKTDNYNNEVVSRMNLLESEVCFFRFFKFSILGLNSYISNNSEKIKFVNDMDSEYDKYSNYGFFISYSDKFLNCYFEKDYLYSNDKVNNDRSFNSFGFSFRNRLYKMNLIFQKKDAGYYSPFYSPSGGYTSVYFLSLDNAFSINDFCFGLKHNYNQKKYSTGEESFWVYEKYFFKYTLKNFRFSMSYGGKRNMVPQGESERDFSTTLYYEFTNYLNPSCEVDLNDDRVEDDKSYSLIFSNKIIHSENIYSLIRLKYKNNTDEYDLSYDAKYNSEDIDFRLKCKVIIIDRIAEAVECKLAFTYSRI